MWLEILFFVMVVILVMEMKDGFWLEDGSENIVLVDCLDRRVVGGLMYWLNMVKKVLVLC